MAIPDGDLTLHGSSHALDASKRPAQSAILCKIDHDTIREAQEASRAKKTLHFVSGSAPTLRIGGRTIDLILSPEDFHHELYSAAVEPFNDLHFAGLVSHRAELKERRSSEGSNAALAALQSSLATHQQEKEANAAVITNTLLPTPKNRYDAAREQRQASRRSVGGSQNSGKDAGASHAGKSQISMPPDRSAARSHAMRTAIIHLLAVRPLARSDVQMITRIPRHDLDDALQRVGQQSPDGKYTLMPRAYKDLDVWKFKYHSQEDRQLAIENAVKAYDRLRLGKEDKEWQLLLPKEERGKGKILSKLLSGNTSATPLQTSSPMPHPEVKGASSANTPRLGAATTPKIGAAKGDAVARLLSKDPKKARAAEEAKGKKRKEKEALASASDKEGGKPTKKKQVTKSNNPKIKSQEIVHSSADEDSAEESAAQTKPKGNATTKSAATLGSKAVNNAARKVPSTSTSKASPTVTSASVAREKKPLPKAANGKTTASSRKLTGVAASSSPSTANSKPLSGTKSTAAARNTGKVTPSALSAQSIQRTQQSPQAPGRRPTVPSPLGVTRPRGVSSVSSESIAPGSQRSRAANAASKPPATTNGAKKHRDHANNTPATVKINGSSHTPDPARNTNGATARKAPAINGNVRTATASSKRKYDDSPQQIDDEVPASKHRKTHSSEAIDSAARSKSFSGSPNSFIDKISYKQAVDLAEQFQKYYPKYEKLYDDLEAKMARDEPVSKEERETLLRMHDRLKQMKAEIRAGSVKEHLDD